MTFLRFILNGLLATCVHYGALSVLIEIIQLSSAGIANGIASLFGIATSYLGNRSYVFRTKRTMQQTLPRFMILYAAVAFLHTTVLVLWTDVARLPYTFGFLIATGGAVLVTFLGNASIVFLPDAVSKDEKPIYSNQAGGEQR